MVSMKRVVHFLALFLIVGISLAAPVGSADYPVKPVSLVAAFTPGGTADLHARAIAPTLEKILKQPVEVINKPGAGGALGSAYVAASKPDGYTLLMGLSYMSYMPEVDSLFNRPPTFRHDQFEPIALLSKDPAIFVVNSTGPYKTVADVVADAKKRPDAVKYSSAGFYSTLHVAMETFVKAAGIKMKHIPYAGGNPATIALLGGHVECLAVPPSVVKGQVDSGTLRVLAVWSDKRLAAYPKVPTLKELGYDAEFYVWAGMFAPKGTSPQVIQVLRDAVKKVVMEPAFVKAMENIGTPPVYLDAPEFTKFWEKDAESLSALVRHIGKVQ
jgi:tripartite-type tricarboxylate transporter receptor subunit TctC